MTGPVVRHSLDVTFDDGRSDDSTALLNVLKMQMAPTADGFCSFFRKLTTRSAKVWTVFRAREIANL